MSRAFKVGDSVRINDNLDKTDNLYCVTTKMSEITGKVFEIYFVGFSFVSIKHDAYVWKFHIDDVTPVTSENAFLESMLAGENICNSSEGGRRDMKFIGYAIGGENESSVFIVNENGIAQKFCIIKLDDYDENPIEPFIIQEELTKMYTIAYAKDDEWKIKNLSDVELNVFKRAINKYRILESWTE